MLGRFTARVQKAGAHLSGFSNHVPKPVEPLELVAVIASATGRTGLRAAL
jgi:hypothetical protein